MVMFGEPRDWPRLLCLGLIVGGVVGMRVVSPH
jgi:multidrug transporter EmrE-like cation transporter